MRVELPFAAPYNSESRVRAVVEQAETKAETDGETKHRHLLIDPDDFDTVISTKWLIDGLVPLQEISLVFGPPKNLKTFLVLALLLCVATGREFFGRKVHRAKVLYIIGEGTNAFLGRIKAWQKLNDVPSLEKHFKYDRRMINLFADDGLDCAQAVFIAMQAQGFRPDVVAIDTLGRAMGSAKETTEDFNKIFATLDAMAQDYWPGVTLVIVSHTRKADMTYRGPQVIAGDCDNMINVERLEKELRRTFTASSSATRLSLMTSASLARRRRSPPTSAPKITLRWPPSLRPR